MTEPTHSMTDAQRARLALDEETAAADERLRALLGPRGFREVKRIIAEEGKTRESAE